MQNAISTRCVGLFSNYRLKRWDRSPHYECIYVCRTLISLRIEPDECQSDTRFGGCST